MKVELKPGINKNASGKLGEICNNCAGYGFTLGISGTDHGCHDCDQSGVKQPTKAELSNEIKRLNKLVGGVGISELTKILRNQKASRQFWEELISWATASATAIATSTTETVLFPNVTIPANYMQDGRALRITSTGAYGTTSTPTLIYALRWGGVAGTVIAKSSTVTTTSGTGGGASMTALWNAQLTVQTRSNGSSGTLFTNGEATLHTSTAVTAGTVANYGLPIPIASGSTGGTTPVAVTCDLTADTALSFTALWGTSNAANSIQGNQYFLESMN